MDKKTTYIIAAVVLIIIIGGLWFIMQNASSPNEVPSDNTPGQPLTKKGPANTEVKSETQVAKELNGLRLTMDDNNQTMSMTPGKKLVLMLGTGYNWTIASSDESVLGKETATISDARVQAIYKALKTGKTVLTASGVCAAGKTCATPKADFKYTIEAVVTDDVPASELIK